MAMKTIVILFFCLTGIATAQIQLGYKSESIWFNHTGPAGNGTDELPLFNLYLTGGYKFSKAIFTHDLILETRYGYDVFGEDSFRGADLQLAVKFFPIKRIYIIGCYNFHYSTGFRSNGTNILFKDFYFLDFGLGGYIMKFWYVELVYSDPISDREYSGAIPEEGTPPGYINNVLRLSVGFAWDLW